MSLISWCFPQITALKAFYCHLDPPLIPFVLRQHSKSYCPISKTGQNAIFIVLKETAVDLCHVSPLNIKHFNVTYNLTTLFQLDSCSSLPKRPAPQACVQLSTDQQRKDWGNVEDPSWDVDMWTPVPPYNRISSFRSCSHVEHAEGSSAHCQESSHKLPLRFLNPILTSSSSWITLHSYPADHPNRNFSWSCNTKAKLTWTPGMSISPKARGKSSWLSQTAVIYWANLFLQWNWSQAVWLHFYCSTDKMNFKYRIENL